jgi:hypothetical protein
MEPIKFKEGNDMENNKIIKVAAIGFIGLVMAPAAINIGLNLIGHAANGVAKVIHKHRIKKGLKDGSIVEIDGQYYEARIEEA